MAAEVQGTAHLFGMSGTIGSATVLSFSDSNTFGLVETTVDENGRTIEWRGDDRQNDVTIEIRMQSGYSVPTLGDVISYNSVSYFLTGINKNEVSNGFRILSLSLKDYEAITPA
jgi:hypothetical protein